MSNIANQVIAVVATLLGFVAHDTLTERDAAAPVVASASYTRIDPIVTRSVNFEGLSIEGLSQTPRAERAAQPRPAMRVSVATAAARPDDADAKLAQIQANQARVAPPGEQISTFLR